jgi:hypothetical protein
MYIGSLVVLLVRLVCLTVFIMGAALKIPKLLRQPQSSSLMGAGDTVASRGALGPEITSGSGGGDGTGGMDVCCWGVVGGSWRFNH